MKEKQPATTEKQLREQRERIRRMYQIETRRITHEPRRRDHHKDH